MIKLLQLSLEVLLGVLVLVFAYSQVVRPLVKKTPVFPMFRRRRNLEREIEVVEEGLEDKGLEGTLNQKKKQLGE